MFLAHKQTVKEVYQQIFVDFLPEDALEAHVRERIDKPCHCVKSFLYRKNNVFYRKRKTKTQENTAKRTPKGRHLQPKKRSLGKQSATA